MPREYTHLSNEERFWAFVRKSESCWEWQGSRKVGPYGQFNERTGLNARRQVFAHRYAYELMVGPIPAGLTIDHLCVNPPCVNPAHLEAVTQSENSRRNAERRTHCKWGHEFSPANTYVRRDGGGRQCLTCRRANKARFEQRRRERAA